MDMEDELSRQYGQLSLTDSMGNLGIVDSLPLQDDEGIKPDNACNLIVNYLPHDVDDLSLRALFQEFGEIIMTKVVRDKNTKKSMGYGFVKFVNESDAMNAIEKMNGYAIGHKNLKVSVARPPSLEIRNCKLYVTNLPKEYSEREVIALFEEFGEIIECRVLKDRNLKVNKGVAFVQFNVKAQANNALSLNGCQLEGSSRPLVVKYAEDQHKKKELNRLHNLTINNAFRGMGGMGIGGGVSGGLPSPGMSGGMPGINGMGGMPPMGGGIPGSNGMPSPKPRLDNKDMLNTAYFYQQQSLPSMYAAQPSPMSMLPSPMNQSVHSPTSGSGWFNALQPSQMQYIQNPGLQLSSPLGSQSVDLGFSQSHLHTLSVPLGGHSIGGPPMPSSRPAMGGGARPPPLGMGMINGEMDINASRSMLGMGYPLMPPSPHGMSPHGMPSSPHSTGPMGVSVIISNLPSMADVTMLHDLCAPYGRIISANLEDSRRGQNGNGSGSNSTSPGSIRGRVYMETVSQAEMVAQSLHGAVLFEGCPPLQVQISLNGSPLPQHRL